MKRPRSTCVLLLSLSIGALVAACPGTRSEGLDRGAIPEPVQADYDVFAHRCSKCHALSRALDSGIVDDDYWKSYVARMRRMPGSGISGEDEQVILRFLHWYSADTLARKKPKPGAGS